MLKEPVAPVCCTTPRRTLIYHGMFWTLIAFAILFALVRRMYFYQPQFAWGAYSGFSWRFLAFFGALAALTLGLRRLPLSGADGDVHCDPYAREGGAAAFTFFVLFFALFFTAFSELSPLLRLSDGWRRGLFWLLQGSVLLVFAPPLVRSRSLLPLVGFAALSVWAFAGAHPWVLAGFWPLAMWAYFETLKDALSGLGFWRAGFVLLAGLFGGWAFAKCFGTATAGWQWMAFLTPLLLYVFNFSLFTRVGLKPAPPAAWSFPWSSAAVVGFVALAALVVFFPSVHAVKSAARAQKHGTSQVLEPFPHTREIEQGHLHITVDSAQVPQAAGIKGYAGPVGVIVRFDHACTIEAVRLGAHHETPSFVDKFSPWMQKFIGVPATRSVMDGIDTVSGATLSTRAIRHIVHEVRARVCTEILKVQTDTRLVTGPRAAWHVTGLPVAFLLIALVLWFLLLPAGRLAVLVMSLVVLGIVHNYQLSLVDLGLAATGIFPSAFSKTLLLLAALGAAVLAGPLWCSFLCPVGAAQEVMHVISRLVRGRFRDGRAALACDEKPLPARNRWVLAAGFLKYVVLAAALGGFAVTLDQRWLGWDPLSILFALPPQSFRYYPIAIAIAVSSVFTYRPYCRFFCPLGAAFLLLGKFAPLARFFPIRILRVCDFGAKSAHDLSCIHCQRCCKKK